MRIPVLSGLIIAFVFVLCFSATALAADAATYKIYGMVTDENRAGLSEATVTLLSNGTPAQTLGYNPVNVVGAGNAVGYYEFNVSQPGQYQVKAISYDEAAQLYEVMSPVLTVPGTSNEVAANLVVTTSGSDNSTSNSSGTPQATLRMPPTPPPVVTPAPSPGLLSTFIPAVLVICLCAMVLGKRD